MARKPWAYDLPMRFRSSLIVGIPLLLVLHGSSAAEQRPGYGEYARPPIPANPRTALSPLPWEGAPTIRRLAPEPASDDDRHWGSEFGLPIPNGAVNCVAIFSGDVIIGGELTYIGGKRVGYIARWDGTKWMSLGAGVDAPVDALLADGSSLYVGGKFTAAGGIPVQGLARWDGSSWSAVGGDIAVTGSSFGGTLARFRGVRALAIYHGELIAGGDFESTAHPGIRGIARFDGTEWKPLGTGIPGVVYAMATFRDSLYAVGAFDSAGEASASNIARWDGATWNALGGGIAYPSSAIAAYNDRLYVGEDEAGRIWDRNLTAWNGAQWDSVGDADFHNVQSLAVHDGKLFVGDYHGIRAWDGSQWTLAGDCYGWFLAMTSNGPDMIFVGDFTSRGFPLVNVGRWDGAQTQAFETWNSDMNGLIDWYGDPAQAASLTSYRGKLLTFGYIEFFGSDAGWGDAYGISAWSGSSWRPFDSTSPPFNALPTHFQGESIAFHSSGDFLYLGGQFQETAPPNLPHAVIQFDGATWSGLDTLAGRASAVVKVGGVLYAAVSRDLLEGQYGRGPTESVLRWVDGHWEEIGIASSAGTQWGWLPPIAGLSEHGGDLVAHGSLRSIDGITVNGIARWNGREWLPFGAGPRECVWPLNPVAASLGDRLVIQTCDCINPSFQNSKMETWDGRSWSPVPRFRGFISSIAGLRGLLYVGGFYQLEGAGSDMTIATWDGLHWAPLGSGLDSAPFAIVEHDGAIYFGGPFSTAGDKSSFGIARWNELRRAPPARRAQLTQAGKNPFHASADLSLHLDGEGVVRVAVYDVNGREVAVLEDGFRSAGQHGIHWDGRDNLGRKVPTGVYFISARTPSGTVSSRKLVRLR